MWNRDSPFWFEKTPDFVRWPGDACRALPAQHEEIALNARAKSNAKSGSNATNRCIISTGEIFADGAIIDLVSGSSRINKPDVLLWNGSKAIVGPRVEHGGCIYEASKLTPSLHRALRLRRAAAITDRLAIFSRESSTCLTAICIFPIGNRGC